MPIPNERPSLTTTLDQRYARQHAGGAFEVKDVLGPPGAVPIPGQVIDAASQNGAIFQNPNGFQVKMMPLVSQLRDVQAGNSSLSLYIQGLDTRKYHG
ncbi:MAG TPA: hypothetical protein PLC59_00350 [Bacteroidales bacterium]|jgi:hypothetical protein|nr:hypothetical protein [Bacteroidales bacterium]